jgi:hypothetical protein
MKTLRSLLFLALGLALLIPGFARAVGDEPLPIRTVLSAVDEAATSGQISEAEAVLYRFYALFSPEKLPAQFRVDDASPIRCGTPAYIEAWQQRGTMSLADQEEVERDRARPNLDGYIDTPHFRVHYSTTGANKIYGWPNTAFRDSVVASCERGYNLYVAMGFPPPPSDGSMGGNSKIDCYCDAMSGGIMGVTFPETPLGDPYPNTYTAYFEIDHDMTQYGGSIWDNLRVTVVHEYMHVVQMGMNAQTSSWWMENCATWSEDQAYDESNQYVGYLRSYFARPWIGLRTADGAWEYACMIWPTYLGERFGVPIVRDIWFYDAINTNLTTAFDNTIAAYNAAYNWDLAANEWARWNYYTCDRADGNHYSEGGSWRDATCMWVNFDGSINTYPQTDVHPSTGKWPQGLGTNYTRFKPQTGSTDNHLTVTFTGLNACEYNFQLFFIRKFAGESVFEEYVVPIDASGHATFELNRWNETDNVHMGVELKRACGSGGKDFSYSASTSYAMDVADGMQPTRVVRLDQNAPNPFNPVTTIKYATMRTEAVKVDIFDAAGRHIRSLVNGTMQAGEHQIRWFGDDDAGRHVPAGLYLYSIQAGDEAASRKMLMVE